MKLQEVGRVHNINFVSGRVSQFSSPGAISISVPKPIDQNDGGPFQLLD